LFKRFWKKYIHNLTDDFREFGRPVVRAMGYVVFIFTWVVRIKMMANYWVVKGFPVNSAFDACKRASTTIVANPISNEVRNSSCAVLQKSKQKHVSGTSIPFYATGNSMIIPTFDPLRDVIIDLVKE
jgi:hypothetical protein